MKSTQRIMSTTPMNARINASIENRIDALKPEERRRVLDTIEQLNKGYGHSTRLYADGSGVAITVYHPTLNHGCPCVVMRSFDIETGLLVLAGHRMKSHNCRNVFNANI